MATYAIGDIQGCYQTFILLLNKIQFNPEQDELWLAGDLINRGEASLEVLEFALKYKKSIRCVLGNHDLHFLAVESGEHLARPKDTFQEILESPKREKIVKWLKKQPLMITDKKKGYVMSHAGLPPAWGFKQAQRYANEVTQYIQSNRADHFFAAMYGDTPAYWSDDHEGVSRLRYITNGFTRMRFCYANGELELKTKGAPGSQPPFLYPWYQLRKKKPKYNVLFGHWASLVGECDKPGYFALDTGCVWGRQLSALRLEDQHWFRVDSIE